MDGKKKCYNYSLHFLWCKKWKKNETLFLFAHFNKPVFTVYYETPIFWGFYDIQGYHRSRCCHVKAYAWHFEMAHFRIGSKPRSRGKIPRWLTFQILNFEMAQNSKQSIPQNEFLFEFWAFSEFKVWKSEPSRNFATWSRF